MPLAVDLPVPEGQEEAPGAGRYKLAVCHGVQPWPESDEGFLTDECIEEAGLAGVEPIPDVCVEVEFDFPRADGTPIVVELSGR